MSEPHRRAIDYRAIEDLCIAAKSYLATNRVFRSKPIGAPGSPARQEQDDRIQAEDGLIKAIMDVEERVLK